jgi:DNA-directed RNA polymerase subunit RPC12/RpoP
MTQINRVTQEFYCGECQGYFLVTLNMHLNFEAHIKCPECGHEHRRVIKDGEIHEKGRHTVPVSETILTTKATYSKEPFTDKMKTGAKRGWSGRRDGAPMDYAMKERWLQVAARERGID